MENKNNFKLFVFVVAIFILVVFLIFVELFIDFSNAKPENRAECGLMTAAGLGEKPWIQI